jgi:asparagine synthase (glutamine-hydrolysing)
MCGINFTTVRGQINRMNLALAHRGLPGRTGTYSNPKSGVHIGHVRLPIVGVGHKFDQPYQHDRKVMSYAGEIFNFRDLVPDAKCDTPVLFEMYSGFGAPVLRGMDGFWSFIYHDERLPGIVEVVTDDLGKKPLYIHLPTLSVSSEIKALVLLEPEWKADELYFSSVAKWGYHIGDRTPFSSIRKLPIGSVTVLNLTSKTYESYPWAHYTPAPGTDLRAEIEKAVYNRMLADVPISILLSGGLDSTIIYKLIEAKTHDFTIYHVDNDESEFLDCLNIPSDIRIETVDPGEVDLGEVLFYNESPVDLGSMIPQYAMSQAIHMTDRDLRVILTGDGADELFGGYRRMADYDAQYSDVFEELVYYHLPRLDRLSMAHSLELRSPFLARPVVLGALALPYSKRVNKKALKEIFEDIVPREIINRPKWPLKSKEVLHNPGWRQALIRQFRKETMYEY